MQEHGALDRTSGAVPDADLFPHDRVVFFSDAVFAIAITLLAIELKVPDEARIHAVGAARAYSEMIPLGVAYVVSFLVAALFWTGHMATWKHVTRISGGLVWLNIFELMFIALLPFGTSLYSESILSDARYAFAVYCCMLAGASLFGWLQRRAVVRQERLYERIGRAQTRWFIVRATIPLLVFAASIPLALLLPTWAGGYVFMLTFPLSAIARRRLLRGHDGMENANA